MTTSRNAGLTSERVGQGLGRPASRTRPTGRPSLTTFSGENVAFVLILAGPLLRRLPRFGRLAAGVTVLVVFGTMTRWEPSVLAPAR